MAWTYTDSPATVPRDAVRCEIGDTDPADQQPISDNEIAYFLSARNNVVVLAAMDAAAKLAAYYARKADTTNGKLQVSASQRCAQFRDLASDLQLKANALNAPVNVFAGGLTVSGKQVLALDTDAIQPTFSLGQDDEPGTDSPNKAWSPN